MSENELIATHNSQSYKIKESYEVPELPGHKFEMIKSTTLDLDENYCPIMKYVVIIKHILPDGSLDLENFKMHVFLVYPDHFNG